MKYLLIILLLLVPISSSAIIEVITLCDGSTGADTGVCGSNDTTLKGDSVCLSYVAKEFTCTVSGTAAAAGLNVDIDGSTEADAAYYGLYDGITANGNYSSYRRSFSCLRAEAGTRAGGTLVVKCIVSYY